MEPNLENKIAVALALLPFEKEFKRGAAIALRIHAQVLGELLLDELLVALYNTPRELRPYRFTLFLFETLTSFSKAQDRGEESQRGREASDSEL